VNHSPSPSIGNKKTKDMVNDARAQSQSPTCFRGVYGGQSDAKGSKEGPAMAPQRAGVGQRAADRRAKGAKESGSVEGDASCHKDKWTVSTICLVGQEWLTLLAAVLIV